MAAFYTLDKIRKGLQDVTLKEPAEFTQDLESAGRVLPDASREVRSKSLLLEKATVILDDAKERDVKYREDIFAELQKLKLQPPQKPAQPAPLLSISTVVVTWLHNL